MPAELLLLLLAWAGTLGLIVVLPWAVIRLAVAVLEADVSKSGADDEHAQPRYTSDAEVVNAPSRESDAVEPAEPVPAAATADEDANK